MSMFNILLQYRGSWLYDVPRIIFAWIDRGIYWLIARLYELIVDLAYIRVFDDATLGDFYTRIYGLLSIVMLFKVTFSVISYILDPSKMSDKQQGFGKIITNILVMFVMLISCPVAFDMLYEAQDAILSDDIIPNFIFGDNGVSSTEEEYPIVVADSKMCAKWDQYIDSFEFEKDDEVKPWNAASKGDYIAMAIFRSFYGLGDPDVAIENDTELDYGKEGYTAANWCVSKNKGGYNILIENSDVSKMLEYVNNHHSAMNTSNDYYLIDYKFFLSTAVGVYCALMFLSLAFDIAVRAIQLSFLQLIAPIPIISYIDPASSKNGTFSKWIKNVGKTWASLFIRLFAVFLSVFVISKVDSAMITNSFENTGKTPESTEFFIMLFIIIGALMFAKKLPQLIEELIPGMKMGKMQLNPFKKIADEAVGGKMLLGAGAGAIAGAAAGATNFAHRAGNMLNFDNYRNASGRFTAGSVLGGLGKGIFRTAGSTIAGQASAGFRAWSKTAKDGKVGSGIVHGHQTAMYAKLLREDNRRKGGTWYGSLAADLHRYTGTLNAGQREILRAAELDQEIKERQDALDLEKRNLEQDKRSRLEPYTQYSNYAQKLKDIIDNDSEVKNAQKKYEEAKASGNRHQMDLWSEGLKSAKKSASVRILRDNQEAQQYIQRMEQLRTQNDTLKSSDYNYINSDGSFNSDSINNTKTQERIIGLDYEDREREFARRQTQIEAMKHTEEYIRTHEEVTRAKTDNASRWPTGPQQPGFRPSPNRTGQFTDSHYTSSMNNDNN